LKKLINNGVVVTSEKTEKLDILIAGGVIAEMGADLPADEYTEVIDAKGMYVMPGGVDVHTHLNLALGERHVSDGFYAGTVAAAFGGTTTIVDHPEAGAKGCSLHQQPDYYKNGLREEAVVDYGVHGVFQHVDKNILNEIPELISEGIPSMKAYTTYDNMLKDTDIKRVLAKMKESGGLTAFHAEDDDAIKFLRFKFADEGKFAPIYHAKSRPDSSEEDAIRRIIELADGAPVYIVHLTTAGGLDVIKTARRNGAKVYAETCPQYLLLEEECYEKPDSLKYIMAPPLRQFADNAALWNGLVDGSIDVIATDHCSFSYADKVKYGAEDFRKCPGGSPGVETRLPLIYSEGVVKGRLSVNRFVELVAEKPAKLMGMYPRKGCLAVGSDADIIIWDKDMVKTVTVDDLHQKCDYTPFEGFRVTGWPVMTFLRGEIIVDKDKFTGRRGGGMFIPRKPFNTEAII